MVDGGKIGENLIIVARVAAAGVLLGEDALAQRAVFAVRRNIDLAFFTVFHRRSASRLLD